MMSIEPNWLASFWLLLLFKNVEVFGMTQVSRRGFISKLIVADEPSKQTLVCIFLRGAADTLNMLIPYGDDQYFKVRATLAIPAPSKESSLRLDDFYAFHPRLSALLPAFNEGRLGLVQAVGTDNPTGSHFEAQDQMEHGEAYGHVVGSGWLGRYLRTRLGMERTPLSAVALGSTIPESLRGAPAASALESVDEVQIKAPLGDIASVLSVLAAMYQADGGVLSQQGKITLDLLKRVDKLRDTEYKPEIGVTYADEEFSRSLKEVARLVKADVGLEVACVDLGGWDTHFFQGSSTGLQAELIGQLAAGLAAFDADLVRHRDRVTTLVMTEFGRRIYENGSLGTDHGRGFALLAMGNGIHGGKVHGKWPGLTEETSGSNLDLTGPSGLKVLIDYRSVLAEVLTKVFNHKDVSKIFPNFRPETVGIA
jgi:uncharacterized protein (DUF1501 family)